MLQTLWICHSQTSTNEKEEAHMKKLFCLILALAALSSHAFADGYVNVKPGKNDLTKAQVKEFAVAFFAEKCGVE